MEHCTQQLKIAGGNRLFGKVEISGAKNAAVAIIPAALCAAGISVVENVPEIEDVLNYAKVLETLGAKCDFCADGLRIDARNITTTRVSYSNLADMRASYYLMGVLLGRFGQAEIPLPGGCKIGQRPIDLHIKGFEALGATVVIGHGVVKLTAEKLVGAQIYLDVASVGATINIMLAAIFAEGTTTIENAAKEPHIVDCANFLNMCGASVKGAGTDVIRITGSSAFKGSNYTIIPDQIEAGTYMIAAAITGGDVTVSSVIPKHMESLSAKLQEMGCTLEIDDDSIRVIAQRGALNPVNIKTMFYPGFPTDLQPQMTTLLSVCNGTSYVTESIFDNRYLYADQLSRLGVKMKIDGRLAVVDGPAHLTGTEVVATDLRAGASLVIAALAAEGVTKINNVKFIDRGYEKLEEKLAALGANIMRVNLDKIQQPAVAEKIAN
ncbi:MAG: UDP-N-acetylglucosamine 1-carboxyvinyltransferase [Defluviitaleaceae bacterium]|nr:UDP-N-acetylglucosamine 1-carboxyvinyltransferase [Defluviitaleaceae bacterium]